jgi:hypothetical protein
MLTVAVGGDFVNQVDDMAVWQPSSMEEVWPPESPRC